MAKVNGRSWRMSKKAAIQLREDMRTVRRLNERSMTTAQFFRALKDWQDCFPQPERPWTPPLCKKMLL